MFELARWSTDPSGRLMMELPLRVAGYHVDVAGIVNNQVYVRWCEDLRTAYMTRFLSFEDALGRGLAPTLVRIELDYRLPLRFGDPVVGRLWTLETRGASAVMEAEIRRPDDGRIACHALQTVCFVDARTGRPARLPPEFRAGSAGPSS